MGVRNSNATVGTSSGTVVSGNSNRRRVVITNDSASTIYLSFGETAVLNKGFRLNANGGVFDESGSIAQNQINGIAGSAGLNVCTFEETF